MGAIIWLASYPKSGNTWMRAFLHNFLINADEPVHINAINAFSLGESKWEHFRQFDRRPPEALSEREVAELRPKVHALLTQASPDSVFVKTHNFLGEHEGVPLITMAHTAGALYMVRNPLDIVDSYANHFGLSLDEAIEQMADSRTGQPSTANSVYQIYSSWSRHVESWTQGDGRGRLVVRYEDMAERPLEAFGGVVRFLGLDPPRQRLEKAIAHSSFDRLRGQEDVDGFVERSEYARFFRHGRAGRWRDILSDDQVRAVVEPHRTQMARFGYLPEGF